MKQPSLDPIHNFEARLLGLKSYGIFDEKRGLWTLWGTFPKSLLFLFVFAIFLENL